MARIRHEQLFSLERLNSFPPPLTNIFDFEYDEEPASNSDIDLPWGLKRIVDQLFDEQTPPLVQQSFISALGLGHFDTHPSQPSREKKTNKAPKKTEIKPQLQDRHKGEVENPEVQEKWEKIVLLLSNPDIDDPKETSKKRKRRLSKDEEQACRIASVLNTPGAAILMYDDRTGLQYVACLEDDGTFSFSKLPELPKNKDIAKFCAFIMTACGMGQFAIPTLVTQIEKVFPHLADDAFYLIAQFTPERRFEPFDSEKKHHKGLILPGFFQASLLRRGIPHRMAGFWPVIALPRPPEERVAADVADNLLFDENSTPLKILKLLNVRDELPGIITYHVYSMRLLDPMHPDHAPGMAWFQIYIQGGDGKLHRTPLDRYVDLGAAASVEELMGKNKPCVFFKTSAVPEKN